MNTHKIVRIVTVLTVVLSVATVSFADQFGNPAEPALRPYKGLWRGLKAFTYQVVKSLNDGNHKFPGLGVVELGRGVRYGTVELLTSTFMGMAGSLPKPVKYVSRPNRIIDSDWLLRNVADTGGGAIFWAHWGATTNAGAAMGVFAAQKIVDHSPILTQRERDMYLKRAPRYAAQREYLGERGAIFHSGRRTNFLTRARQEHIVVAPPGVPAVPPPLPGMPATPQAASPAAGTTAMPPISLAPAPAPAPGSVGPAPLHTQPLAGGNAATVTPPRSNIPNPIPQRSNLPNPTPPRSNIPNPTPSRSNLPSAVPQRSNIPNPIPPRSNLPAATAPTGASGTR